MTLGGLFSQEARSGRADLVHFKIGATGVRLVWELVQISIRDFFHKAESLIQ